MTTKRRLCARGCGRPVGFDADRYDTCPACWLKENPMKEWRR